MITKITYLKINIPYRNIYKEILFSEFAGTKMRPKKDFKISAKGIRLEIISELSDKHIIFFN